MENWEKQNELKNEIKNSLKGELDESATKYADILFHDELARGRVLNRLYKLFSSELELAKQEERDRLILLSRGGFFSIADCQTSEEEKLQAGCSLHQNNNEQGGTE